MSLLNKIKADALQARKDRDTVASNLLVTLSSEAGMIGKNNGNRDSTDEEVLRVVKKFLDNARETFGLINSKHKESLAITEKEIAILETYMPAQMSEDELTTAINLFKADNPNTNMGAIMKYLQANYAGRYDGKRASQIAKG
jgi:uncharacterized protein YqeY